MKTFIFRNTKTGETKPTIQTETLVLADEFFGTTYHSTNEDWETKEVNKEGKPFIDYELIPGDNDREKAMYKITADGVEVAVIRQGTEGINSGWSENTLYEVERKAKELFPDGFYLPYYVDQGSGYVYKMHF